MILGYFSLYNFNFQHYCKSSELFIYTTLNLQYYRKLQSEEATHFPRSENKVLSSDYKYVHSQIVDFRKISQTAGMHLFKVSLSQRHRKKNHTAFHQLWLQNPHKDFQTESHVQFLHMSRCFPQCQKQRIQHLWLQNPPPPH